MAAHARSWSTGGLLLVCSGLGVVLALELSQDLPFSIAPQVTAAPPAAPDLPAPERIAFEPPPPGAFAEIAARPLFSSSRRPFEPPAEAGSAGPVTDAEPAPLTVELIGVLLTARQRSALLQPEDGGSPAWLHEGQTLDGWLLEHVAPSQVTLRSGERVEILDLRSY